jgi:protoporphyrinogen oxidase
MSASPRPTALVLGGGLAGLTVARALQANGFQATILEAQPRAGGKAGCVPDSTGYLWEHGYHIFAPWYANMRRLTDELGVKLIEVPEWHYIERSADGVLPPSAGGPLPKRAKMKLPVTPFELVEVLRNAPLPKAEMLLYFYFVLDMIGLPIGQKALLDQVSRVGLMRDRWYSTPIWPQIERESLLKASAVPAFEMSAYTAKILSSYFLKTLRPSLMMLPGDLQHTMIDPFVKRVADEGVIIEYERRVEKLVLGGSGRPRIDAVLVRAGADPNLARRSADVIVVATPLDVTRQLIGADVLAAAPGLGCIQRLRVAPMAALHLELVDRMPNIPKEHVFLSGGQYGLSFIDVTTHWPGRKSTLLSFIASDFLPLQNVTDETELYGLLMEEIGRYLPIRKKDVQRWKLNTNAAVGLRLFINTAGSWPDRPNPSSSIENLFFAGDWVKNRIDLACMEGAVSAAQQAAHEIGLRWQAWNGVTVPPPPLVAPRYPPWMIRLLVWALAPVMAVIYGWARISAPPADG